MDNPQNLNGKSAKSYDYRILSNLDKEISRAFHAIMRFNRNFFGKAIFGI